MAAIVTAVFGLASCTSAGFGKTAANTPNKIDMAGWSYNESDDVYYQVGLSYAAAPADTKYETLGIFIPGKYMNGTKNEDGSYTLPKEVDGASIRVEAVVIQKDITVEVANVTNGTITAAALAGAGETIKAEVKAADGFRAKKGTVQATVVDGARMTVLNGTKNSDGTYSFKMPASKVTVTPVIIEDEPVPLANRPFVDVPEGSWFYDAVYHCYDSGYFQGVDDTHYDPQGTMTRAMFATVLYRIAGEPEAAGENPFTDVDADTWYTDAVIWAAEEGIIGGYGNGLFGTNDPVTREQMVAIFWRYNGQPAAENTDLSAFTDADQISTWAQDAFAWAVEIGVISGKGNGVLDPKGTATRAEVAQIVMNYDTKVK